jgi:hypothetical protein
MRSCCLRPWSVLFFCAVFLLTATSWTLAGQLQNSTHEKTTASCKETPLLTVISQEQLKTLGYTRQRLTRALCGFAMTPVEAETIAAVILSGNITFETLLLTEYFITLPHTTIAQTLTLIKAVEDVEDVDFQLLRTINAIQLTSPPESAQFLEYALQLSVLKGPVFWTVRELILGCQCSFQTLTALTEQILPLDIDSLRVVEAFLTRGDFKSEDLLLLLEYLKVVTRTDLWNIAALFSSPDLTKETLNRWLTGYFLLSKDIQEKSSTTLTDRQKKLLLGVFDRASENPIRALNNLHDVTDHSGREINDGQLLAMQDVDLVDLFEKLHPAAQNSWRKDLDSALQGKKSNRVTQILHRATEQARKELAGEMTSAQIYILLSHGGELYTSSFRNILTPALQEHITSQFQGDLLNFLAVADPENLFTSQFITSLAWRGQLSQFMPDDTEGQKNLLKLVAESALQDPFSLLHFSASFEALFMRLQPESRSFFLTLLEQHLFTGEKSSADLVQVLLQLYLERFSDLIEKELQNHLKITISNRGNIDTLEFKTTPFLSWLEDKKLQSLSIFQHDDDGRTSYISFCRTLRKNGYTPSLSLEFNGSKNHLQESSGPSGLSSTLNSDPHTAPAELFTFSVQSPLLINWEKVIKGVKIIHTTGVYHGREHQLKLLEFFFNNNIEMYAQRGHSYYRRLQLLRPLKEMLQKTDGITANTFQRFLSLGSCGGIRSYLELTTLFHNKVDILATTGTGKAFINNHYNVQFFESITKDPNISWDRLAGKMRPIFEKNGGKEYLQPGSLTAILHKQLYQSQNHGNN